jgi:hypothetical protein
LVGHSLSLNLARSTLSVKYPDVFEARIGVLRVDVLARLAFFRRAGQPAEPFLKDAAEIGITTSVAFRGVC